MWWNEATSNPGDSSIKTLFAAGVEDFNRAAAIKLYASVGLRAIALLLALESARHWSNLRHSRYTLRWFVLLCVFAPALLSAFFPSRLLFDVTSLREHICLTQYTDKVYKIYINTYGMDVTKPHALCSSQPHEWGNGIRIPAVASGALYNAPVSMFARTVKGA